MKIRTSLVHLTTLCVLSYEVLAQNEPPQAHIVNLTLDLQSVTVLHLHPGFVSSVRLPEEVSSVVLGDPAAFKGEHSEAEPRLVFFKPAGPTPAKSNTLISTRNGREVSLTLVSDGASAHAEPVDYVLEYRPQRSFLISAAYPSVLIGESKTLADERGANGKSTTKPDTDGQSSPRLAAPLEWRGRELRVAVGWTEEQGSEMTVAFSIANNSPRTVELLPPQVQLSGTAKRKHQKAIKAEPVAVKEYQLAARRLPPGGTTEGTVVFERPAFKESREQLLLQIAQAEEVDRPVLAPIAFVGPSERSSQMIPHEPSTATIPAPVRSETIQGQLEMPGPVVQPIDFATRAKLRAREHFQQNRFVIIGAGALVVALLIFVAISILHKSPLQMQKTKVVASALKEEPSQSANAGVERSLFPITDSGAPAAKEAHEGFLNEKDLERSVTHRSHAGSVQAGSANVPGSLGSIPPFGPDQPGWQAPPYQTGPAPTGVDGMDLGKAEREAMEKSLLIYVRNVSANGVEPRGREKMSNGSPDICLGLSTGTRLRARLEASASTAVRAPVLAVVEYTYEQIVVPAGAKAVGHIQDADRSGYVRIQFESLMMPDGDTFPIQAVATDLDMGPLKGKVEGKNTGKNVLVRSLSGIGQAGALLLGQGSLNQPLSESDLIRERFSNNIGEASDEEISV